MDASPRLISTPSTADRNKLLDAYRYSTNSAQRLRELLNTPLLHRRYTFHKHLRRRPWTQRAQPLTFGFLFGFFSVWVLVGEILGKPLLSLLAFR
jgi:hypothetical protein